MKLTYFLLIATVLSFSGITLASNIQEDELSLIISSNIKVEDDNFEDKSNVPLYEIEAYELFSEIESLCDKQFVPFIKKVSVSNYLNNIIQKYPKEKIAIWAKAYDVALHFCVMNYDLNIKDENHIHVINEAINSINTFEELEKEDKEKKISVNLLRKGFFMNLLGYFYRDGIDVEKNMEKAIQLYRDANKLKNPHAMNNLGYMYYNGIGVEKNTTKSFEFYEKAINLNHTMAMFNLAHICSKEIIDGKKDIQKSIFLYEKAANLGNADALYKLGYMRHNGINVQKDTIKAIKLYEKAIEFEHPTAMNDLAIIYFRKNSESLFCTYPKELDIAMNLFFKATELGSTLAMFNLGDIFYRGLYDIKKDRPKGIYFWQKAAELGHQGAINALLQIPLQNWGAGPK